MVKKLFKHEMHALWRLMIPIWCMLGGASVLGRLIQLFEQDSVAYSIISGSAVFFYIVLLVACIVCPFVFAVTRFYRNLFTGEGYLSFTLPVTASQHIWVKLAVAMITQLVTLVAAALSVVVVTFGDLTIEIGKALWYLFKYFTRSWGAHMPMYLIEGIVGILLLLVSEILLYYACICIGQLSKKNRILTAVGAYFGFYAVKQVLGTIVLLISVGIDWNPLLMWMFENPFATVHLAMCGGLLWFALLGTFYFFLSHYIISRRLNLE